MGITLFILLFFDSFSSFFFDPALLGVLDLPKNDIDAQQRKKSLPSWASESKIPLLKLHSLKTKLL